MVVPRLKPFGILMIPLSLPYLLMILLRMFKIIPLHLMILFLPLHILNHHLDHPKLGCVSLIIASNDIFGQFIKNVQASFDVNNVVKDS
jgi:hypothetical protein